MFLLTDLVSFFPNLGTEGYRRISNPTIDYNCIAWAAGDDKRRWDVEHPLGFNYWPAEVPKRWTTPNLISVFRQLGYELCEDGGHDAKFEKIAIYVKGDEPKHAARQLEDGQWTSKLGDLDDITHTLQGLTGEVYGRPEVFLRRLTAAST